MAIKLNLLPPEYVVSGAAGQLLKTTRMLGVIFLAAFLIFALGLVAFFIISSVQLRSLTQVGDTLKSQITAEEQSEQQMILLKDRIKNIKTVQGLPDATRNLTNIEPVVDSVGGSGSVTELSIDSQKIDLSALFKTNTDLPAFITKVKESGVFKSVILTSFGFNSASGYLVSLRFM